MPIANPRISVIIPSFNHGRFLERALCSVLDQGYANLDLHVIDGGSDDDTLALLAMYDDQLASWSTAWDAGPAEAINHGLNRANGDLVLILDADDLLLPGALLEAARAASQHPTAAWFVGDAELIDDHDTFVARRFHDSALSLPQLLQDPQGPPPLSCCVFRAATLDLAQGVDAHQRHTHGDDLVFRLLDAGLLPQRLPAATTAQRHHDRSAEHPNTTTLAPTLEKQREALQLLERYADRLPPADRFHLWQANQQRKRILALAQSQSNASAQHPRSTLWMQALRHPWWLTDPDYRHHLLHNTPNTALEQRHAA